MMRCKNCGAPDPGPTCRYCQHGEPRREQDALKHWPTPPPPTGPNPGKLTRGRGAVDIDGVEVW